MKLSKFKSNVKSRSKRGFLPSLFGFVLIILLLVFQVCNNDIFIYTV